MFVGCRSAARQSPDKWRALQDSNRCCRCERDAKRRPACAPLSRIIATPIGTCRGYIHDCPVLSKAVHWTKLGHEGRLVSRTTREVNLSTSAARERLKPSGKPYYR